MAGKPPIAMRKRSKGGARSDKAPATPIVVETTEQVVALEQIRPHPDNYNTHDEAQIARLVVSLQTFGQVRNVVLWAREGGERYITVAGHGVIEAARRVPLEAVRANVYPEETPPDVITAYLVADNEHARHSTPDEVQLAALLEEAAHAGYPLEALGSSQDELEQLLADLAAAHAPPSFEPASEDEQGHLDERAKVQCPHCGHEFVPER